MRERKEARRQARNARAREARRARREAERKAKPESEGVLHQDGKEGFAYIYCKGI